MRFPRCWSWTIGLSIACSQARVEAPPARGSPGKSTPEAAVVTAQGEDPVKLLCSGTEPRHQLRYRPAFGKVEETVIGLEMELSGTSLTKTPRFPRVLVLAELHLSAPPSGDDYKLELALGSVPTTDDPSEIFRTATLCVSNRGVCEDCHLDLAGAQEGEVTETLHGPVGIIASGSGFELDWLLGPNLESGDWRFASRAQPLFYLPQHVVPLPEAAVGIGAKWSVLEDAEIEGIGFHLTTTYELLAWEKDGARLRARLDLELSRPGTMLLAPETEITLKSAEMVGTAELTIRFDRLLALGHQTINAATSVLVEGHEASPGKRLEVKRLQNITLQPFGAQGLSPFPSWTRLDVPRLRFWQVNYCATLEGARGSPFQNPAGLGASGSCRNGKLDGPWETLLEEGGTLSGTYAEGLPTGVWRQQSSSGKLLGEYSLDSGNGTIVEWWDNGEKRLVAELSQGLPNGRFMTFFPNGSPHLSGSFSQGKKRDRWLGRDGSGNLAEQWLIDPKCRIVGQLLPDRPGAKAGLEVGDWILRINRQPVESADAIREAVLSSRGHPLVFEVDRGGKPMKIRVTPARDETGIMRIGMGFACHQSERQ